MRGDDLRGGPARALNEIADPWWFATRDPEDHERLIVFAAPGKERNHDDDVLGVAYEQFRRKVTAMRRAS